MHATMVSMPQHNGSHMYINLKCCFLDLVLLLLFFVKASLIGGGARATCMRRLALAPLMLRHAFNDCDCSSFMFKKKEGLLDFSRSLFHVYLLRGHVSQKEGVAPALGMCHETSLSPKRRRILKRSPQHPLHLRHRQIHVDTKLIHDHGWP